MEVASGGCPTASLKRQTALLPSRRLVIPGAARLTARLATRSTRRRGRLEWARCSDTAVPPRRMEQVRRAEAYGCRAREVHGRPLMAVTPLMRHAQAAHCRVRNTVKPAVEDVRQGGNTARPVP